MKADTGIDLVFLGTFHWNHLSGGNTLCMVSRMVYANWRQVCGRLCSHASVVSVIARLLWRFCGFLA